MEIYINKSMNKQFLRSNCGGLCICIAILVSMNLACMGMKKPWRDYTD